MNRRILFIALGSFLTLALIGGGIYWLRTRDVGGVVAEQPATTAPSTDTGAAPPTTPGTSQEVKGSAPDVPREDAKEEVTDKDFDGLTAAEEKEYGTDAAKMDTDGDSLADGIEIRTFRTDPLTPDPLDQEGRPLIQGLFSTTTSRTPAAPAVTVEPLGVTAPVEPDTDQDGLTAAQEQQLGTSDTKKDTDGDGLSDREEAQTYRTDPLKMDSDGDTFPDASEIQSGYNPLGSGRCVRPDCIP